MKYTLSINKKEAELLKMALVHYEVAGEVTTSGRVTVGEATTAERLIENLKDILDFYYEDEELKTRG